jgi:hypothetical protein
MMSKFTRRWDRRRRARALRKINKLRRFVEPLGTIRQFLYLDTVALRSLYVSRYGPEDARITITDARTRDAELSGSIGHSTPGIVSARASATLRSSTAESAQIERVASEQSLFRDFLERETDAGVNSQLWDGTPDPKGFINASPRPLRRGDLIQVRIRLQADLTYRISSFASAITDLAEGAPEMQLPGASATLQVAEVLRQLLIEQAPIDAELMDWGWDKTGKQLAINSKSTEPLRLVALTQIDNYWLDVRRALFDGAECVALVRVGEDVPSMNWSPLKLFDAVRGIPGFDSLDDAIQQITASLDPATAGPNTHLGPLTNALTDYVAKMTSGDKVDALAAQIRHIAAAYAPDLPSASAVSTAFDDTDQLLAATGAMAADPNEIAAARADALIAANLSTDGAAPVGSPKPPVRPDGRYLVGEIVALYW